MSVVSHRRRTWGALWGNAPWDGKPKAAAPVVAPVTQAALAPTAAPARAHLPRARQLLRVAFGRVFAEAPWRGRTDPLTVTPTGRLTDTPPPVGTPADRVPTL